MSGTSPISSSSEVQGTSSVVNVKKTEQASGTKNVPMVDVENQKSEKEINAQKALEDDINNENAWYNETGFFGAIGTLFDSGRIDNEIIISGFPEGTTLGDIKKKYNLPAGSLKHLVESGGGKFDNHKAPSTVVIFADDMQEGLGVSAKELKKMFPPKQFSPWHSFGTKE